MVERLLIGDDDGKKDLGSSPGYGSITPSSELESSSILRLAFKVLTDLLSSELSSISNLSVVVNKSFVSIMVALEDMSSSELESLDIVLLKRFFLLRFLLSFGDDSIQEIPMSSVSLGLSSIAFSEPLVF